MRVQQLFSLEGRVALVTGGSRGLGLEIAEGLGEAGARVAITARREQWLAPAAERLRAAGIDVLAIRADVSQPDAVAEAVRAVLDRFGRVDVLINNAGISWGSPALDMPLERWRQVLDVNATGPFLMSKAVAPSMIAQGAGVVVNVASVAGLVGTDPVVLDAVGYAASKGALIAMTRDLAVKWAPHGIRVNAIAPGFFRTRMSEAIIDQHASHVEASTPMGRIGRDDELKGVAVFLASDASAFITGQVVVVDGGMTAA
jgi:NAD(P)-dependent dehydrogenase (short-subunit alcohol dehydrogenase family)